MLVDESRKETVERKMERENGKVKDIINVTKRKIYGKKNKKAVSNYN